MDGTRAIPDHLIAVARLVCGHAKIIWANVGIIERGWSTHCQECDAIATVDHPIFQPQAVS